MSCEASQADLCWTRGDTGRLDVTVTDADGEPYSIAGGTLFLTVKTALSVADASVTLRKEVTSHDNAAGGVSHFDLSTSDNATAGTFYYDVQLKTSDAKIYTLFGGVWRVLADVTTRTAPLT